MQELSLTLSSIVATSEWPPVGPSARREIYQTRRTLILQRMLNFLDIPIPEIQVWGTLQEEARSWATAVLARLIAQTTFKNPELEEEES